MKRSTTFKILVLSLMLALLVMAQLGVQAAGAPLQGDAASGVASHSIQSFDEIEIIPTPTPNSTNSSGSGGEGSGG